MVFRVVSLEGFAADLAAWRRGRNIVLEKSQKEKRGGMPQEAYERGRRAFPGQKKMGKAW